MNLFALAPSYNLASENRLFNNLGSSVKHVWLHCPTKIHKVKS
jgi:hypothetical protein